jgi:DNA polymerase/3'-5' exonuclease PolX
MEADNSELSEDATHYCSIAEAMKLITHPFDGDKRRLREFIENVDVIFELVDPSKHDVLLKFVKAKITGEARSKLMVRDLTHIWELVKAILEEKYATRRTLDFYACRMFSARQRKHESIASWGNKIDELQTDLRETARRVCRPEAIL